MAVQIPTFHGDEINVVNRDDGRVAMELEDPETKVPTGVVLLTAEGAIELGKALQAKGEFLWGILREEIEGPKDV
ncbi:hypothetical protein MYRNA_178 [Mycobacterium phage Myrna]|uniref:Uncharacterized protein n=1 Tax=Mycobacterium phage Myrna TaxID=546805 RepID=B5LJF0_9CAUD|nr:gp178 [Mycobacterium phage Myrna]ACH62147.1 hypothetical protein MYRNA_178 [Mycobacterium phage Myrna]